MNTQDTNLVFGRIGKDIYTDPDDVTADSVDIPEWRALWISPGATVTTMTLAPGEVCNGIDGTTFDAGIMLPVRFTQLTGSGLFIFVR